MYLKLKYNRTCDQSETYGSRKKYREIYTVTLCKWLVMRKLSHKSNSKISLKTIFYASSFRSFAPHQIQSLYTLWLYYPVAPSFIFSVSHSHLLTCSCPATISVALYWCPKYLMGVIGIPVSSTVLAAHREIFQGCHIPIVKLRVTCILLLSPFF